MWIKLTSHHVIHVAIINSSKISRGAIYIISIYWLVSGFIIYNDRCSNDLVLYLVRWQKSYGLALIILLLGQNVLRYLELCLISELSYLIIDQRTVHHIWIIATEKGYIIKHGWYFFHRWLANYLKILLLLRSYNTGSICWNHLIKPFLAFGNILLL